MTPSGKASVYLRGGEYAGLLAALSAEVRVHQMQLPVAELIQFFLSVMTCPQKQDLCVTDTPFREQLFGGKCSK